MIAISSTTFDSHQAETVTITAVSDRTISFTPSLQHKHLGKQHSLVKRFFSCLCVSFLDSFFSFFENSSPFLLVSGIFNCVGILSSLFFVKSRQFQLCVQNV